MNGCSVPRRFFERTRERIQHHPITKEKQNGDKTEKKQEMAATSFKGGAQSRSLAFQINGEIRFQNGICNSHANCQAVEA